MRAWRRWRLQEPEQAPLDWLVVGLGNPGPRYADTRHNLGRVAVEALARQLGTALAQTKFNARFGLAKIGPARVVLAYPLTFMNESGRAVAPLARFFKVPPARLLVVTDDLDLPLGRLRLRAEGGAGGHNGLSSVIQALGTTRFPRLRLGIGRPPAGWDPADYVLAGFGPEERIEAERAVERACAAVESVGRDGLDAAMSAHNG